MIHHPVRRLLLRDSLLVVGLGGLGMAGAGWWGARAILIAQAKARADTGLVAVERRVKDSLGEAVRTGEALAQMGRLGQLAPMTTLAGEQQLLAELKSRASLSNLTFVLADGQASAANAPEAQHHYLWATRGTHFEHRVSRNVLHLWDQNNQLVETMPDPAAPPDWRLRPWVLQGQREGHGCWTAPYLFLGKVGFGLTYAIPVAYAGQPLGVLGVDLVLGDIRPWLSEAKPTPGTSIAILDGSGNLLVPPEQEQGATDPGQSRVLEPMALVPALHPIPFAVQTTPGAEKPGIWPSIKIGRNRFLVQRHPLHLEGGLDWVLLVAIPERDLMEKPRQVALVSLAISLCALAFLAWRMVWSSHQIAEPLERLAAQAEALVDGGIISSPDSPITEVQGLARSLRVASLALKERDNLEGQLRLAQRREMIGTLAAGVAHDLGNLLSVVGMNLERAQEAGITENTWARQLENAALALRRSQGFLRALLSIGRPVEAEHRPVELGAFLRDSCVLLEPLLGAQVSLSLNLPDDPLPIHGDPIQLEQILLNLVLNGRDAMPRGGPISLAAGRGPDRRPYFSVADAGDGIPPAVRDQLFTPFFTTKARGLGSGLGLAMVQGIAKAHGAEIEVESELGMGSRFTVRFPLSPEATSSPNQS